MYAKVILVYLLAVNAISSPKRLERLTWVLVLAVGYVAFRAVLDYARGVNLIGPRHARARLGGRHDAEPRTTWRSTWSCSCRRPSTSRSARERCRAS
jgi:hypothetical protein